MLGLNSVHILFCLNSLAQLARVFDFLPTTLIITPEPPLATSGALDYSQSRLLLDCIVHKLQHLKNTNAIPSATLTNSLHTLDNSLNK
jgi:hypothetical protein